jgi:prophage regulatory protein
MESHTANGGRMETDMKLLDPEALEAKGIKFSDTHICRLIRAGKFPKPVKIGARNHWVESEIDEYIANMLAKRDQTAA